MNRSLIACASMLLVACDAGSKDSPAADGGVAARTPFTLTEARDPEKCKSCHPNQYREWASSMHAYAAKDPVFVAMNKRGQRETHGTLGNFCVNCHAPMAVRDDQTTDGLNLDELPPASKGVTCYFCHNTIGVDGDHNDMLRLANDVSMRGPISDARQPGVHRSEYSVLLDESSSESSTMCGGCHDIVTPAGVHLERTFEEYQQSIYAKGTGVLTCASCHMDAIANQPVADDPPSHVPGNRTYHQHLWPGVDVALTDFPDREAQRRAVECNLAGGTTTFQLAPNPQGTFDVVLETNAGHRQPSGAAQDRRMWFEFKAFDVDGKLLPQSSGVIADGELEDKPQSDPKRDSQLWLFRDRIFGQDGQPVHMFWDAAPSAQFPDGYDTKPSLLPTPMSSDPTQHSVQKTYRFPLPGNGPGATARVVGHLRMRPMGVDVLQDLVDSGDLDPAAVAQMPTFTLAGTEVEWKVADGYDPVTPKPDSLDCPNTYLCLLRPGSSYCDDLAK
jgi:nitrate/TMAO reductase-like tetraheme cytochrome c subunit